MPPFLLTIMRQFTKAVLYLSIAGLTVFLAVFVYYMEHRPDLKIWHDAELDAEFTAESPIVDFSEYIQLEESLFQQLEEKVYARIKTEDRHHLNRFNHGSMSDPGRWPRNWNRTFELTHKASLAGVLLLHGMSDSPYSLRNIGRRLHKAGATVIGLRIPGHGTAPSGLIEMQWQDMAAAVRLAMNHLEKQVRGQPLYIIGYSNGSALAIHYALLSLNDAKLPKAAGLVLVSPAIGVTKLAAFAVWQGRLGHLLGLDKLAWNSLGLEYDPFKYNSFAINAGDQVYRLTSEIQRLLAENKNAGRLLQLPPILAFQSVVDTTVSTAALATGLFEKLPAAGHEMVLFDINRINGSARFFKGDPKPFLDRLLNDSKLPFSVTLATNVNETTHQVHVLRKKAGESAIDILRLDTVWPRGIHSLSHIALPFPQTDPLYGLKNSAENPGVNLGNMAPQGERGVLRVPASAMLRLRWNPFYPYIELRILDFVSLDRL